MSEKTPESKLTLEELLKVYEKLKAVATEPPTYFHEVYPLPPKNLPNRHCDYLPLNEWDKTP